MSEQTFSTAAVVSDNERPAQAVDDAPSGPSKKVLLSAVSVIAVIAVAAYFLFFSGGSEETAADQTAVPHASPSASASVPGLSASADPVVVPKRQASTGGRDPFRPLLVAPVAATSAPTPAPRPATSSSAAPSATSGASVPTSGVPNQLSLTSIDSKAGVVATKVNGKAYTSTLGTTFARYFKLIGIGPTSSCAIFQYGDVTVPLCQGQSISLTG